MKTFKRIISSVTVLLMVVIPAFSYVSNADDNKLYKIEVKGTYSTFNKDVVLDKINKIRKEAYDSGIKLSDGTVLKKDDYKALKWSSDIEKVARERSAEAIFENGQIRPNGEKVSDLKIREGFSFVSENLDFNSEGISKAIDNFYFEKKELEKKTSNLTSGNFSNYENIISPKTTHIAIAGFKVEGTNLFSVSTVLGKSILSETEQLSAIGYAKVTYYISQKYINQFEISKIDLKINELKDLKLSADVKLNEKYNSNNVFTIVDSVTWESSDKDILEISKSGVKALKNGKADIIAKLGNKSLAIAKVQFGESNLWSSKSFLKRGSWKEDKIGKWYSFYDGKYPIKEWFEIDEKWYYFDKDGYMVKISWVGDYYLGNDGVMLVDTVTPDGYRVDRHGKWDGKNKVKVGTWKDDAKGRRYIFSDNTFPIAKWLEINGKWYNFDKNGYMVKNSWVGDYYLGNDGVMLVNTVTPDGYRVDENGKWDKKPKVQKGSWKSNNTGKWFEYPDGTYPRNQWKEIDSKKYYFNAYGYMVVNTWIDNHYLGKDGAMLVNTTTPDGKKVDENGNIVGDDYNGQWKENNVGRWYEFPDKKYPISTWLKINNKWYYFDKQGYMVINRWVGDYYVGINGIMLTDTTTPDGHSVDKNGKRIGDLKPKFRKAVWKSNSIGKWIEFSDGTYPINTWKKIDGKWYNFDKKGYMVKNSWVGDYYVGNDGVLLVNSRTPDGYWVGADGKWDKKPKR